MEWYEILTFEKTARLITLFTEPRFKQSSEVLQSPAEKGSCPVLKWAGPHPHNMDIINALNYCTPHVVKYGRIMRITDHLMARRLKNKNLRIINQTKFLDKVYRG